MEVMFEASSASLTIQFRDVGDSDRGPALDHIVLAAVSEPSSVVLLVFGFLVAMTKCRSKVRRVRLPAQEIAVPIS